MTFEELKAEAKRQGYSLVKAYERKVPLKPCPICHKKPHMEKNLICYVGCVKRYVCNCKGIVDIQDKIVKKSGLKSELTTRFSTCINEEGQRIARPDVTLTVGAGIDVSHRLFCDETFTAVQEDKMLREGWNEAVDKLIANYNIKED